MIFKDGGLTLFLWIFKDVDVGSLIFKDVGIYPLIFTDGGQSIYLWIFKDVGMGSLIFKDVGIIFKEGELAYMPLNFQGFWYLPFNFQKWRTDIYALRFSKMSVWVL